MQRYYVGYRIDGEPSREVFRSESEPTQESHGHVYAAVVGPFRTKRAAEYMAKYGANNPHLQTVADAERLSLFEEWKKRNMTPEA